jgi:hypothetical protein
LSCNVGLVANSRNLYPIPTTRRVHGRPRRVDNAAEEAEMIFFLAGVGEAKKDWGLLLVVFSWLLLLIFMSWLLL